MKRKRFGRLILTAVTAFAAAASLLLFAACASGERVSVSGSSSVTPLVSKLAAAFEKTRKGVRIIVTTSESTVGIVDTADGKNDIGLASRELKASETGLAATKICDDGIVLVVNRENALENVTSDEVFGLYADGTPIGAVGTAIAREEGSGTRDAFDGLIKNADGKKLTSVEAFSAVVSIQNNTGAVMSEIAAAKNKLGYISLGSLNDTVKALSFGGVAATAEHIRDGSYRLARPFYLVTKEGRELPPAAKRFFEFILSEEGQRIIAENGYAAL